MTSSKRATVECSDSGIYKSKDHVKPSQGIGCNYLYMPQTMFGEDKDEGQSSDPLPCIATEPIDHEALLLYLKAFMVKEKILKLSILACEGCQESYPSQLDHACLAEWEQQETTFFDAAVKLINKDFKRALNAVLERMGANLSVYADLDLSVSDADIKNVLAKEGSGIPINSFWLYKETLELYGIQI